MQRFVTVVLGLALVFIMPNLGIAQPTVDGSSSSDPSYIKLGEWTQNNTGFGDHGMLELYGYVNGNKLYVMVVGEAESNFNEFYVFLNGDSPTGVSSGTQLPSGSDSGSPFSGFQPTNDFETDYGVRLTVDGNGNDAYVSIIDYVDYGGSGNATDTFLGTIGVDGTKFTVGSGDYSGMEIAYDDTGNLSNHTGVEGWEFAIPLSAIGASTGEQFELFALYGADDYISANTLPEIPNQGGTNLESNPDFTTISGDQHSSQQVLPVELASFEAQRNGSGATLNWKTASETNNSGFAVQHAAGDGAFEKAGWVDGAGTTTEAQTYSFSMEELSAGTHRFRLKQVDLDGTTSFSDEVSLQVQPDGAVAIERVSPHPVKATSTVRLTAKESGSVTVTLYDVLGRQVKTLHEGRVAANQAEQFTVDGSTLASGTYFLRVTGEGFTRTKRITVAR